MPGLGWVEQARRPVTCLLHSRGMPTRCRGACSVPWSEPPRVLHATGAASLSILFIFQELTRLAGRVEDYAVEGYLTDAPPASSRPSCAPTTSQAAAVAAAAAAASRDVRSELRRGIAAAVAEAHAAYAQIRPSLATPPKLQPAGERPMACAHVYCTRGGPAIAGGGDAWMGPDACFCSKECVAAHLQYLPSVSKSRTS